MLINLSYKVYQNNNNSYLDIFIFEDDKLIYSNTYNKRGMIQRDIKALFAHVHPSKWDSCCLYPQHTYDFIIRNKYTLVAECKSGKAQETYIDVMNTTALTEFFPEPE